MSYRDAIKKAFTTALETRLYIPIIGTLAVVITSLVAFGEIDSTRQVMILGYWAAFATYRVLVWIDRKLKR